MRLLLDTHVFRWWSLDDRRLPKRVHSIIANPRNELLLSVVSAWEIAIKVRRGSLRLPESVFTYIPSRLAHHRIDAFDVTLQHTLETASLPLVHHDPYDRLLISQCRVERVAMVTGDEQIRSYPVETIW